MFSANIKLEKTKLTTIIAMNVYIITKINGFLIKKLKLQEKSAIVTANI